MRRLSSTSALTAASLLLSGCVADPIKAYRDARRGNYMAVISAFDQAPPPSTPRVSYRARAASYAIDDSLQPLRGVWTGSMDCGGQNRSFDLFIFDRHPRPRSLAIVGPMTTHGRAIVEVRGTASNYSGDIQINPYRQITYPPGYRPVSWSGSVQLDGTFAGTALGGGCGSFRLRLFMGPDDTRFIKAERDNGGFRRALLASEYQTANSSIPEGSLTGRLLQGVGLCGLAKCPGINLPGIIGAAPGASSSGGGTRRVGDTDERVKEQQSGGGWTQDKTPSAPTPFPDHFGSGPGYGITH